MYADQYCIDRFGAKTGNKAVRDALIDGYNLALGMHDVSTSYYLVRYCGGSYEDYYSAVIFVTNKKSTATKYVTKFNRILKKWKKYYEQFENNKSGFGMKWIADEHIENHFERWYSLKNITKCYYEKVSFR